MVFIEPVEAGVRVFSVDSCRSLFLASVAAVVERSVSVRVGDKVVTVLDHMDRIRKGEKYFSKAHSEGNGGRNAKVKWWAASDPPKQSAMWGAVSKGRS